MDSARPAVAAPLADMETRRLSIRRLNPDDLDGLAALLADVDLWPFEYERGLTRRETEAFLDRQSGLWTDYTFGGCGVREIARPELVGVVGLAVPTVLPEHLPAVTVGWRFARAVWGKGYATEAATAVLDQAFTTMGLDRVGCVTGAENLRSVALAERLGMRFVTEATVQRADGNGMVAVAVFQVSRADWR
jgi:RimJ/RimL family protein N-acetyltransferase